MTRSSVLIVCIAASLAGTQAVAQQTYRRAEVDSSGQLHVITSSGHTILPPKDSGQATFEQVAISPDRRTVGWVAYYSNLGPSYPISLELVLLTAGTERTVIENGLPIWRWSFSADGRSVALMQAPLHGSGPLHYELRDVRTGHLRSSFDTAADTVGGIPGWARTLTPHAPHESPPSNRP